MLNKYMLFLLILSSRVLIAQEETVESNTRLFYEITVNGIRDFDRTGIDPGDLSSTLGYGWGVSLQTTVILNENWGLAFRVNHDMFSIMDRFEDEDLEEDLPRAVRQSIYQGLVYTTNTSSNSNNYLEGTLGFGWSRYRIPTIKFESGYNYEWNNVNGLTGYIQLGYGFQYSKSSSIKLSLTTSIDFLSHEYRVGSFFKSDHGEYFIQRISIGHVTQL